MSQLSFHAHRSGHEALQYCPRRRYLAYHHLGTGINVFPPIYFDIGTAVHAGLASLLTLGITHPVEPDDMQDCINVALQYFYECPVYQTLPEYDRNEQVTLISGLLWAFYYRAWPSFAEKYEVLMVERPSTETRRFPTNNDPWQNPPVGDGTHPTDASLTLHSRPDAIVMDRHTGEVVAINWKTINTLTDERRYNITSSLQVNLEHYYAERLYSRWMDEEFVPDIPEGVRGRALMEYLDQQQEYYKNLPREVAYSQIVYLVKGDRSLMLADGTEVPTDAGDEYGDAEKVWRQNSFLCYRYLNLANGSSSWTGRHYKAGNKSYSLLTPKKDWVKQPVWEGEEWNTGDDPPTGSSAVEWWVQLLNSGTQGDGQRLTAAQRVEPEGTPGPRWVDVHGCFEGEASSPLCFSEGEEEEVQPGDPISPVVTQTGHVLVDVLGDEIWEVPSDFSAQAVPKPALRFQRTCRTCCPSRAGWNRPRPARFVRPRNLRSRRRRQAVSDGRIRAGA